MVFLALKQCLQIIVGIYKGAPIFGMMIETLLGVSFAWFFYLILKHADKVEKEQIEKDRQYAQKTKKQSPWYVGINDPK